MNVEQVLAVMLEMAPQLLPIINGNNPDGSVITCDGAIIETFDTASEEERKWDMVDLYRNFVFRGIKTEEELRKHIADYIPKQALVEIQAGYDPALPPTIGNYFYNLMYHAAWKLNGMADQNERSVYAGKLVECLSRIAPPKFQTVPQKYFDAFRLGL